MDYMANGMEMNLLEPEERKEVEFIWNLIITKISFIYVSSKKKRQKSAILPVF